MTRRSRIVLWASVAAVLAIALVLGSSVARRGLGAGSEPPAPGRDAAIGPAGRDPRATPGARAAAPPLPSATTEGTVAIAGRVIDIRQQRGVAGVEVVFRGAAGETQTTTRKDGAYAVRVAAGTYHAFVRDDAVLSVGRRDPMRLPGPPLAETAGVPDEALMAAVIATRDVEGLDLSVVRGGTVSGHVVDRAGRPVAGAVLRAIGSALRPALATDLAESGGDGAFELRLPAGAFELEASHPRFAGIAEDNRTRYVVEPGDHVEATVVLAAGCVISGRVVARDGSRGGDGAIERQWGTGELEFTPAGQIDSDGAFRWATTEEAEVTLRAWPWRSPPSPARRFSCRDGARFDGVVFRLPDRRPDLEGVLVDHAGQPLGFTFVDLRPLDPGGIGQQERTDAAGRWEVYSMPPGRYRITARTPDRGVASATVVSPRDGIRIELGGTGRLEGTTPRLARGSFELVLESCFEEGSDVLGLPQSRRLVTVAGGRFAVDDLPACELTFAASWRGRSVSQHIAIPPGGAARIELDLGEPHDKTVRGVVRDPAGKPIAEAIVGVVRGDDDTRPAATARTDAAGAYTIKAFSGANLSATVHGKVGHARVGGANVDSEQVDLVVDTGADADAN
jgi:protocatechuate 3,4-dioxygenase beta subunit